MIVKKLKKEIKGIIYPTYLDIIVKALAKKYNVHKSIIEKDIREKNIKYGIEYKEYYDGDFFCLSSTDFNSIINAEKEWFAESIAKIKEEEFSYSLSRMERICHECEISYREYYHNKFYNLHEFSILNLVTIRSQQYKKIRMDIACKLLNKSKGKIRSRMAFVKKYYGVNNSEFLSHDYCYFSNMEIKKEKNLIDYPYLISQESKLTYSEAKAKANDAVSKFKITKKTYKNRLYYTMSDREIIEDIEQRKDELLASIISEAARIGISSRELMLAAKIDNLKYGTTISDYILFGMHDKTEKERKTWINYDKDVRNLKRKYRIKETDLLENKIKFNNTFPEEIGRKWWCNVGKNTFDDFIEFIDGLDEIIIKPVAGKEGKGIEKIVVDQKNIKEIYDNLMEKEVTIVEECIKQHVDLSEFYPDCVHCCRVVAILEDNKCFFPQVSIKFGINAVSDNLATGSICANIDLETGTICTDGATKKGEIMEYHPYSNKKIKGFKIPYWEETLELAEKVIRSIPDINMIGFDIAITNKGPIIVEGNDTPDFRVYEYPLIGQKTGMRYKLEPFITKYKCKW